MLKKYGAEEVGMRGLRERAADIFAKHGEIAANKEIRSEPWVVVFPKKVVEQVDGRRRIFDIISNR